MQWEVYQENINIKILKFYVLILNTIEEINDLNVIQKDLTFSTE